MTEYQRKYRVVIPYREPTYEVHTGKPRKRPYRAPYEVMASTTEKAIINALELFERDAKHALVGWVRIPDYNRIEVTLLPDELIASDTRTIYTGSERRKK